MGWFGGRCGEIAASALALILAFALALAVAFAFLVVIPEGDLLLMSITATNLPAAHLGLPLSLNLLRICIR